ncbi:MAG TPA: hypothetical protein GXX63_07055 [Tissierellia bacterium]|nr:hypothetical protein [Tissierellia bacterium]
MKMLVILSHELLEEQIKEANEKLDVDLIVEIPSELKKIWGNISPEGPFPVDLVEKIIKWINENAKEEDYVLVQGDFGATYYVVDYCIKSGRVPIYATTNREVEERIENGVTRIERVFKHVNFRKYLPHK